MWHLWLLPFSCVPMTSHSSSQIHSRPKWLWDNPSSPPLLPTVTAPCLSFQWPHDGPSGQARSAHLLPPPSPVPSCTVQPSTFKTANLSFSGWGSGSRIFWWLFILLSIKQTFPLGDTRIYYSIIVHFQVLSTILFSHSGWAILSFQLLEYGLCCF